MRIIYEIAAARGAFESGTPMVGICRGMQILNVACGGTLVQDFGAGDVASWPAECDHGDPARAARARFAAHATSWAGPMCDVRTGNHQAVRDVADGFRVVARADDGVIEAIEHATAWAIGVQWHPEDPLADAQDLAAIAESLVEQAAARSRLAAAGSE